MKTVAQVLTGTSAVLLDFDGPVCGIFAGGVNRKIADKLRARISKAGVDLPEAIRDGYDPLDVLRHLPELRPPELVREVEELLVAEERAAAVIARPTPGAHEAIRACQEGGWRLVIVSNNSEPAIRDYLDHHHLSGYVDAVIGRTFGRPDLMKPNPDPLRRALAYLDLPPAACVLIGDSVTDIDVARATGVRSIGFAKASERVPGLATAGSDVITQTMTDLAATLRSRSAARP